MTVAIVCCEGRGPRSRLCRRVSAMLGSLEGFLGCRTDNIRYITPYEQYPEDSNLVIWLCSMTSIESVRELVLEFEPFDNAIVVADIFTLTDDYDTYEEELIEFSRNNDVPVYQSLSEDGLIRL